MSLAEKIASDLINAMKAKDKIVLEAIRAAKTAFILAKAEKGASSVLTPEEELKIIQKLVKQRKESADIYREQNRMDLYEKLFSIKDWSKDRAGGPRKVIREDVMI